MNFHVSLGLPTRLLVSVPMVLFFIAHLSASGSAPASIVSTVSAVAYFHKINGFHDPSNCFMVSKLFAGARNLGTVPDVRLPVTLPVLVRLPVTLPVLVRLPVTLPVLSRLVQALPTVFASWYKCLMFPAMMVLAFIFHSYSSVFADRGNGASITWHNTWLFARGRCFVIREVDNNFFPAF